MRLSLFPMFFQERARSAAANTNSHFCMGQKVHPIGFRLPISRDWSSRWYASRKDFAEYLLTDGKIRDFLKQKLKQGAVSRIVIERAWNSLRVTIHTARPGVVIGRKGAEIENMTRDLTAMAGGKQVKIDIFEIKSPDLEAQLVAENVASQLERRISFRRAMKRAVQMTMDQGALGIKIRCSGRLGGSEIARTEWYREGKIPLHTMRQPIDYGFTEANTVAGKIGIKCWICKDSAKAAAEENPRDRAPKPPPPPPPPVVEPAAA
jgi:small subunit ribosomal protein S3